MISSKKDAATTKRHNAESDKHVLEQPDTRNSLTSKNKPPISTATSSTINNKVFTIPVNINLKSSGNSRSAKSNDSKKITPRGPKNYRTSQNSRFASPPLSRENESSSHRCFTENYSTVAMQRSPVNKNSALTNNGHSPRKKSTASEDTTLSTLKVIKMSSSLENAREYGSLSCQKRSTEMSPFPEQYPVTDVNTPKMKSIPVEVSSKKKKEINLHYSSNHSSTPVEFVHLTASSLQKIDEISKPSIVQLPNWSKIPAVRSDSTASKEERSEKLNKYIRNIFGETVPLKEIDLAEYSETKTLNSWKSEDIRSIKDESKKKEHFSEEKFFENRLLQMENIKHKNVKKDDKILLALQTLEECIVYEKLPSKVQVFKEMSQFIEDYIVKTGEELGRNHRRESELLLKDVLGYKRQILELDESNKAEREKREEVELQNKRMKSEFTLLSFKKSNLNTKFEELQVLFSESVKNAQETHLHAQNQIKDLKKTIETMKCKENKMMYLLYLLESKGHPVTQVYYDEVNDLKTERFKSDIDDTDPDGNNEHLVKCPNVFETGNTSYKNMTANNDPEANKKQFQYFNDEIKSISFSNASASDISFSKNMDDFELQKEVDALKKIDLSKYLMNYKKDRLGEGAEPTFSIQDDDPSIETKIIPTQKSPVPLLNFERLSHPYSFINPAPNNQEPIKGLFSAKGSAKPKYSSEKALKEAQTTLKNLGSLNL